MTDMTSNTPIDLPTGQTSEAKFRELVKPLFLAMHKLGIDRVVIDREGTHCRLVIVPSKV